MLPILIICKHPVLDLNVIFQIDECHEPVLVQDVIVQPLQVLLVSDLHALRSDDKVNGFLDHRTLFIIVSGYIIRIFVVIDDGLRINAEHVNVVITNQIMNLHVRAVSGSQRHGSVQHELHVGRTGGLLGGQ